MSSLGKARSDGVDTSMGPVGNTPGQLFAENEKLRARLDEAEETLRAIRAGEVDALIVSTADGDRVFTLQGADRSYRALIENMNEGALSLTVDGTILYANRKFAAMLQAPLEQVIGSTIQSWIVPESQGVLRALLENGVHEQGRAELNLAARNGVTVPVYLSINPVEMVGSPNSLGMVATDLTERRRTEQAIRLSESKFRNVFECSPMGKHLRSLDGEFRINRAFSEMLGYSEVEMRSRRLEDIMHPDDREAALAAAQVLLQGTDQSTRVQTRFVGKTGGVVWADVTIVVVRDDAGRPLYILTDINDITARKQADAAVQDLKQHLQRNIEMERLRLAQNLHDVPLQELFGVIYKLQELRVRSEDNSALELGEVIANIQKTLALLRATASELRPPTLSRFGLEKAIRSYTEDFREKNPGIHIRQYLARDYQVLPEDVRLVLFRVLQESLANVVRHAQASEIEVRFNFDDHEARLEISDNGKGFAVPGDWLHMVHEGHYGLAGMAERVNSAGGIVDLESSPGASTTVRVIMPYSPDPV